MAKKFFAVEVTPSIARVAYDNNDVIGDFNVLPLPVRAGEACLLRSVAIQDRNHLNDVAFDIVFVKNKTGDAELGTTDGAVDITDANLTTNILLGAISKPGAAVATGGQFTQYSDLITNDVITMTGIDLVLGSSTITPSGSMVAEAQTGCYFGLIARASYDTSGEAADGLTFTFGFEVL
jgi:hypothetical protein